MIRFLEASVDMSATLSGTYDPGLVALSYVVATLASYSGFLMSERVGAAETAGAKWAWLGAGSVAMGIGVWTMHFIGMLAFVLPMPVSYDPATTIVSAAPAVLASALSLHIMSGRRPSHRQYLVGGALIGAGIGVMHYTGMAGMRMDGEIRYDPALFALSIAVAVVLGIAATYTHRFGVRMPAGTSDIGARPISAALMGLAITGMHYTAMAATYIFPVAARMYEQPPVVQATWLSVGVTAVMIAIILLAVAATIVDRRLQSSAQLVRLEIERRGADRKAYEREMRRTRNTLETVLNALPLTVVVTDVEGRYVLMNAYAERVRGVSLGEVAGKRPEEIIGGDEGPRISQRNARVIETGEPIPFYEEQIIGAGGNRVTALVTKVPLRDEQGTTSGVVTISLDVTERKSAEAQLRRAQKMEAVGQLTGGVAHDINNLLTIILGNLQLLDEFLGDDGRARRHVDAAITAVRRGADLTKRLLAFARRQVLDPKVLNINDVLAHVAGMLHRTLGEDVEIKLALAPDLWPARIDSGELEHALINLATNARDAMPKGGQLTIETANAVLDEVYAGPGAEVTPGEYAMAAVTDSGQGMPADVLERAFEPFFTTKETGQGTGLGLAMVYGFVKQSGGHAKIYSEPGHGTTVKLYFPRAKAAAVAAEKPAETKNEAVGGSETVLVVEDETEVRNIAVAALEKLGYRVFAAANGLEALGVLNQNSQTHLLFTDVVMPGGMGGGELASAARARLPNLKVLFCSGYAQEGLARSGRLEAGADLIMKPYDLGALARKVREVLDG